MALSKLIAGTPRHADESAAQEKAPEAKELDPKACTCQASYLPHQHTKDGIVDNT